MTQLSAWQYSCHLSVFCLCPDHWVPSYSSTYLITQAGMLRTTKSAHPPNSPSLSESHRDLPAESAAPVLTPLPFLFPYLTESPTFRCSDAQTSQMCLCVWLGVFHWIVAIQFVVISRKEIQGTPHAIMLLTS